MHVANLYAIIVAAIKSLTTAVDVITCILILIPPEGNYNGWNIIWVWHSITVVCMRSSEISFIAQIFTNTSDFFGMTYNIGKQVLRVDAVRAKGRIAQKKMAKNEIPPKCFPISPLYQIRVIQEYMFYPKVLSKKSNPKSSPVDSTWTFCAQYIVTWLPW